MDGARRAGCQSVVPTTCRGILKEVSTARLSEKPRAHKPKSGSDGDNIVAQFAISYHNEAPELGVDLNDLYSALKTDAELNPPEWNIHGRQVNVYKSVKIVYLGL